MSSGILGAIGFGIVGGLVGFAMEQLLGVNLSGMILNLPGVAGMALIGAILGLVVGVATHKKN
ncbi:MAG: hypothetical protein WBD36_07735 [Bacteroidota bacterium]